MRKVLFTQQILLALQAYMIFLFLVPRSPPNTPVPSDPTTTPGTPHHATSDTGFANTFTVVPVGSVERTKVPAVSPGRQPSPARFSASNIPTKGSSISSNVPPAKPKTMATVPPLITANPHPGTSRPSPKVVHEVSPQVRTSLPAPSSSRSAIPSAQRPSNSSAAGKARESDAKLAVVVNDRRNRSVGDDADGEFEANGDGGCNDDNTPNLGRTFTLSPEDFMPVSGFGFFNFDPCLSRKQIRIGKKGCKN